MVQLEALKGAFLTMATSLEPVHHVNWPVGRLVVSCLIFNGITQ